MYRYQQDHVRLYHSRRGAVTCKELRQVLSKDRHPKIVNPLLVTYLPLYHLPINLYLSMFTFLIHTSARH
jgi:hypothetical protein